MQILKARYFTCTKCGEREEVDPALPADYAPTVCTACWPDTWRSHQVEAQATMGELAKWFRSFGLMS